eukprot:UN00519
MYEGHLDILELQFGYNLQLLLMISSRQPSFLQAKDTHLPRDALHMRPVAIEPFERYPCFVPYFTFNMGRFILPG